MSVHSTPRSPVHQSPDDDSVINLDTVFDLPMPGGRRPAGSGDESLARSAPTPSPHLNMVPEKIQLPHSPLPPSPSETFELGHQRGDSLASHSSYRTSLASTRYASSTARSSTYSFSHGFRSFMDDTPPLPPAPLRTPNKTSFGRDSNLSVSSSYRSDRGDSYSGFDFGISQQRPSALHDVPEERSPVESEVKHDFSLPSQSHLHPADAGMAGEYPRKNSDATSESALSVTSFARALGLEEHLQRPDGSTTSDSSPSEAPSGSSMSSLPSDVSLNRRKPSDPLNLGPLVEELPARTRQTILEMPDRERSTLDEVPPIPAALFAPESVTDPAIDQGSSSFITRKQQSGEAGNPPQESTFTPPPIQRAATTPIERTAPIERPPTRSATKSKGKCKGCGEMIVGKSISSSDGRLTGRYHRGCFVCFDCHSPFQTADFYVLHNRPYCAQHYHERNGSLCFTCHNGIEGHYLETVERNPARPDRRRFHPDCLQCQTCQVLLKGDYFEWNGEVYCEQDARRAAAAYYPPPPPGPPGARRRPTLGSSPHGSSPLSHGYPAPPGYPPRSPMPGQAGLQPGGPRFPSGGARRFPERRTTRLMMI